ncbi:MAG: hypothetical protein IJG68_00855 [Bacilli bacterium]|nr:hypothetical protein [Bacilli bacterium]
MDIETFLGNKGFEIGTDGAKYFSMLLEDVIFALEENIPKEIIREKVIPSAKDFYYRFHRVSKKQYLNKINKFCNTIIIDGNKTITTENVDDMLLRLGTKYIKENKAEKVKSYQKCKKK